MFSLILSTLPHISAPTCLLKHPYHVTPLTDLALNSFLLYLTNTDQLSRLFTCPHLPLPLLGVGSHAVGHLLHDIGLARTGSGYLPLDLYHLTKHQVLK